jgi:hypothetical protein
MPALDLMKHSYYSRLTRLLRSCFTGRPEAEPGIPPESLLPFGPAAHPAIAAWIAGEPDHAVVEAALESLRRRGILRFVESDPDRLEPAAPYRGAEGRRATEIRRRSAAEAGTALHEWEDAFVSELERASLLGRAPDFEEALRGLKQAGSRWANPAPVEAPRARPRG